MKNQEEDLIAAALNVRERAYAPFSKYHVGAAILTMEGQIFTGCNVENASYGLSICAERSAVVKMVSETHSRQIACVVVVTRDGGSPCGACRQVLFEFGDEFDVISFAAETHAVRRWKMGDLLLDGFRLT